MAKWTKNKPVYLARGWYPTPVVFVPSPEAYDKFITDHKIDKDFPERKFAYPDSRGRTSYIETPGGKRYILVFVTEWADKAPPVNVLGVIAHEVQHVLQYLWESIGEDKRGQEQEAYAAQHFFCQITQSFMLTRRPKWGFKISDTETY